MIFLISHLVFVSTSGSLLDKRQTLFVDININGISGANNFVSSKRFKVPLLISKSIKALFFAQS